MTATVAIQTARRDDVLRVPNAALRFRPDPAVIDRFGAKGAAAAAQPGLADTIWVSDGTSIKPVPVTVGVSDGIYSEILAPPFPEGTPVVTRMSAALSASARSGAPTSPLLPARPGPRPPGR
jgi:HlyD family secretion protein